eukprot:461113-Hanusia_phi.AAC.1
MTRTGFNPIGHPVAVVLPGLDGRVLQDVLVALVVQVLQVWVREGRHGVLVLREVAPLEAEDADVVVAGRLLYHGLVGLQADRALHVFCR